MSTRTARRARARELGTEPATARQLRRASTASDATRSPILRAVVFFAVAAIVIGGGLYFAGSVFFARPHATTSGVVDLQVSMAGFSPKVVYAKPGQEVTFNWWNTDGAGHLEGGVHTMVSDTLGIRFSLKAQSSETITVKAPMKPGEYDYWCDSCCGGKSNPDMHGKLVVED